MKRIREREGKPKSAGGERVNPLRSGYDDKGRRYVEGFEGVGEFRAWRKTYLYSGHTEAVLAPVHEERREELLAAVERWLPLLDEEMELVENIWWHCEKLALRLSNGCAAGPLLLWLDYHDNPPSILDLVARARMLPTYYLMLLTLDLQRLIRNRRRRGDYLPYTGLAC